ncbi:MAG: BlaI/MecI/CopY family transcriptional regulator [Nocardioidaceae bacterium]|nr:BlaI/MecI/CopY family transcriptional regulator [Nocardioidaceae bacterium]
MARLGDLERAVMDVLWDADGPRTVRAVMDALGDRALAYTTVMTVLDRLDGKQLVTRERVGRAFAYSPAHDREQLTAELMREALAGAGDDRASALVRFAEQVSPDEAAALQAALARVVARAADDTTGS